MFLKESSISQGPELGKENNIRILQYTKEKTDNNGGSGYNNIYNYNIDNPNNIAGHYKYNSAHNTYKYDINSASYIHEKPNSHEGQNHYIQANIEYKGDKSQEHDKYSQLEGPNR